MRAVVARAGRLEVGSWPEPVPGPGQVLVATLACGICGSDLHALANQAAAVAEPDVEVPAVVFGHEFCAEVLDHGPPAPGGGAPPLPAGTRVCSIPFIDGPAGPELIGYAPDFPGGFAERMVLQADRLLVVPDGVDANRAALAEPLAVGLHAVGAAGLAPTDVALVVGCGPVGLAVIAGLKVAGHGPVVATDLSAARRRLAERAGADVVVDPALRSPYEAWTDRAGPAVPSSPFLDRPRAADTVVFDCVGVPGLLQQLIDAVPAHSRLVVVGVCATPDVFTPVTAITKELSLRFVFAYRPDEYAAALDLIARDVVDVGAWITDVRGLDGAADAFVALGAPDRHCKILLVP